MFRPLSIVVAAALLFAIVAEATAQRRNLAYYGTRPGQSARVYSGEYQAFRPNVVPTFTLPVYGGGYRSYRRGGYYGRGYYPVYQQPVIIYPPAVRFGF